MQEYRPSASFYLMNCTLASFHVFWRGLAGLSVFVYLVGSDDGKVVAYVNKFLSGAGIRPH